MAGDSGTKTHRIEHTQQPRGGMFFIGDPKAPIAEMTYHRSERPDGPKTIVIDHTLVKPELRGQGIAGKLVHAAVDWAREDGLKIHPVCPFAKAVFDKEPELADVRV